MGNGTNWQIEQGCPQCGAPVTLDETDRLLACPFCRTRLYLSAKDQFCYYIPPAAGANGELIYIPYWRLRGSAFSATGVEVIHRFADTSTLAVNFPGLPYSLGLRPQVLKLRFVSPDTAGRFIAPDLPRDTAAAGPGSTPQGAFTRIFIGETISLIHTPLLLRGETLIDAILKRPVCACTADDQGRLLSAPLAVRGEIRFVPTLCPHCGWDMEGQRDSLILICRNCNSAWACPEDEFTGVEFAVMTPPPEENKIALYLPFWRMKPRIVGMELTSYADLIRLANLPKAITPAYTAAPFYCWSPAFKVNPALYLRWARQMTIFRPLGDESNLLPKTSLYPVTLPLHEAAEGIIITLADLLTDKRNLHPRLPGIRVAVDEFRLEYHPFVLNRNELLHASLRVALDRTALTYGIRM
jgi:DNA-directed RNA polymerase subunit RPC12/RpoP